jgi:hypothetical protein
VSISSITPASVSIAWQRRRSNPSNYIMAHILQFYPRPNARFCGWMIPISHRVARNHHHDLRFVINCLSQLLPPPSCQTTSEITFRICVAPWSVEKWHLFLSIEVPISTTIINLNSLLCVTNLRIFNSRRGLRGYWHFSLNINDVVTSYCGKTTSTSRNRS